MKKPSVQVKLPVTVWLERNEKKGLKVIETPHHWLAYRREVIELLLGELEARVDRLEAVRRGLGRHPTEDQRDLLRLLAGAALDALLDAAMCADDAPIPESRTYELELLCYRVPVTGQLARELGAMSAMHRPSRDDIVLLDFEEALEIAKNGVKRIREFSRILREFWKAKET